MEQTKLDVPNLGEIWSPMLLVFLAVTVLGGGASGQIAEYLQKYDSSAGHSSAWFARLKKPAFNPPSWVFGPVWFFLYCCMAIAAYLVWRDGDGFDGCASGALFLYGIQLMLNWTWAPLFFGLHRVFDALVVQILLDFFVAACILFMLPINISAVYLMLPYLVWLVFATVLGGTIWKINCSHLSTLCA